MSFFEEQLDPRYSFGARGGPRWKTRKGVAASGKRSANREWSAPLQRFNITQSVKTNSDFEELRSFFYVVSGAYDGFRFKDWSDFECTQDNSFLTLNTLASPDAWQIQRKYVVGARTYLRDIYKPVTTGQVRRFRAGVWSNATATVDVTTGLADISGHVGGDIYAWIGEFDVPVAFENDEMEAEIVDKGDEYLVRWPNILVEEIRINVLA
jgi:uncharacterized protein (TIGR02217 family)